MLVIVSLKYFLFPESYKSGTNLIRIRIFKNHYKAVLIALRVSLLFVYKTGNQTLDQRVLFERAVSKL